MKWSVVQEEANIVLLGSFNPRIFHPDWFIRKGIVPEWDYSADKDVLCSIDYAKMVVPDSMLIQVLMNQFIIKTNLASEFSAIKDVVKSIFSILPETPVHQVGLNYTAWVKVESAEDWASFGQKMSPVNIWKEAAPYIDQLSPEKVAPFGLLQVEMQFPRNDDFPGVIKPRISAVDLDKKTATFLVNSHIELLDDVRLMDVLDSWDSSLDFSNSFINSFLDNQLGKV